MGWALLRGTTHILQHSPQQLDVECCIGESETDLSEEDGPAVLPPSGRPAKLDADPEMVAMLAQAAKRVWLD